MLLKRIRELDKELRDEFEGFSLFKVSFKRLKKEDQDIQLDVLEWYQEIKERDSYKKFKKLFKERSKHFWKNLQRHYSYLPEFEQLTHLRLVFIADCKKTMPEIIDYKNKDFSNVDENSEDL